MAEGSDLESRRTREGPVGSNPTSSASATSSFVQRDDRRSVLGPLLVRLGADCAFTAIPRRDLLGPTSTA